MLSIALTHDVRVVVVGETFELARGLEHLLDHHVSHFLLILLHANCGGIKVESKLRRGPFP